MSRQSYDDYYQYGGPEFPFDIRHEVNGSFDTAAGFDITSFTDAIRYDAPFHMPTLSIDGEIDVNNDVDVYKFQVLPGDVGSMSLIFDIDFAYANGLDAQIQLFDSAHNLLASNDDASAIDSGSGSTRDPYMTYAPTAPGIYYIAVTSYNNDWRGEDSPTGGNSHGAYTLHVTASGSAGKSLLGSNGPDAIDGTLGNDTITPGNFQDTGADTLRGLAGDDFLNAQGGNDVLAGGDGADTIYGGSGNDNINGEDLYLGSNADQAAEELGTDGDFLNGGDGLDTISGDRGDDSVFGDGDADSLYGGFGNDMLDGGAGADTMGGGTGDDTFIVDNVGDLVGEAASNEDGLGGHDTVKSSISYTLTDNVEDLILTGSASNGTGNALANSLTGNDNVNVLTGLGGGDTYVIQNAADVVDESGGNANEIDTVFSSVSVNLSDTSHFKGEVEDVVLVDAAAINATGNALENHLTGNAGTNILAGRGGSDTYVIQNSTDVVDEGLAGSDGDDLVVSLVSFSLADTTHARGEIERLTLGGSAAINGTGNALDNTLTGNTASNVLSGGVGADIMMGLGGNDIYVVDNLSDIVDESAGGSFGTDVVQSSVTFNLGDGVHALGLLETLYLTGSAAINGSGNDLANKIFGNAAANTLDGKAGDDTMTGGAGNDSYYVDAVTEHVVEANGGGTDTILARSSFSLAAGSYVEIIKTFNNASTLNINLSGNEIANTITGNAGANILNGRGGADILTGLGGADAFVFDQALGASNIDRIADFTHGVDKIRLDHTIFTLLPVGALAATAFKDLASGPEDANDRILYSHTNGALFYDVDGVGGQAAKQIAVLSNHALISAADFVVVP